jgi:hypothetical protein
LFSTAAPPLPLEVQSLDTAAWAAVAPPEMRYDMVALGRRLEKVFLAVPPGLATRQRLEAVLEQGDFPCSDETVREASVVLLGCPEYNLC